LSVPDRVVVGRVGRPHGLAGAFFVDDPSDDPRWFEPGARLLADGSEAEVVAADSRSPRDGKFLEILGRYNPQTEPSTIEIDEAKVKDWLDKGALPTEAVSRLLKVKGIQK